MKKLLLKLLREIRRAKGQFIAITAVIAIGTAFLVGLSVVGSSMRQTLDRFYQKQNLSDLWVYVRSIDDAGLASLRTLPGITDVNGRLKLDGDLVSTSQTGRFIVNTLPERPTINVPDAVSGRLPENAAECMLDNAYAKANGSKAGEQITIAINAKDYTFTVCGFFESAEYVYAVKDAANPVPDHNTFGEIFLSNDFSKALSGGTYNEVMLKTDGKQDTQTLLKQIGQQTQKYGYSYGFDRKNDVSESTVKTKIDAVNKISAVFPIIFFLVAALITFISMSRQIESQRSQIAVLKALGARDGELLAHYLLYPVLTAAAGSIVGILLGIYLIPPIIFNTFNKLFVFPPIVLQGYLPQVFAAILLSVAFGITATWISARGPLRENPAQAMRQKPPKNMKPLLIERSTGFWQSLSYKNKLILRNIGSNKVRAVLSSIGIMGCVSLTITAVGMKHASQFIVNNQFNNIERYQISATLKEPVPYNGTITFGGDAFTNIEKAAALSVSLTDRSDTESIRLNLLNADERAVSIYGTDGKKLDLTDDGVIVSQKFAKRNTIKKGDSIRLNVISAAGNRTVTVKVQDICMLYTSQSIYATFNFLKEQGLTVPATTLYINVRESSDIQSAAQTLKADSRIESISSKDNEFRNYETAIESINTIILMMILASAALALTVVYNISSINIFERRRDLATLKVLGYFRGEVNSLVFNENLIITALGSVFGIGFGVLLYEKLIGSAVPEQMMFPSEIGWYTIPVSVMLGFVFTILANFMLRGRVDKIDMVESLKSVE